MRRKIILGIHGIGNKPPRRLLQKWWKESICEGLRKIGCPRRFFKFELVYWAHYLYSEPLRPRAKDKDSPLYVQCPYVPSNSDVVKRRPSLIKKKSLDLLEKILDTIFLKEYGFINFDKISDFIIRKKFKDLAMYYHKDNVQKTNAGLHAKAMIGQQLAKALKKHRRKQILLVAHSMGSIVAYDVLTQVAPDTRVHTFLTIGSPLGLPVIMKKIFSEQHKKYKKEKKVATPENILKHWYNFSDLNDKITMNYNLADDYKENSHHVAPVDVIVHNDYEYHGSRYPHKSYGYLRAPEVAEVIHKFLSEGRRTPFKALKNTLEKFIKNRTKLS